MTYNGNQGPKPGSLRAWWLAVRPKTLGASVVPVLVGTGAATHSSGPRLSVTVVCLAAAVLLQVGTNLANDAFDFARGVDTAERIGPTRATQAGWLSHRAVLGGALVSLALATACGVYLVLVGGWPIFWIGVVSILAALGYSGGPYPLASHGLGELAAFIFFGLVAVAGTAYLHTFALTPYSVLVAVPIGALVTCIMVVNNLRDIPSDAATGKRTLAVRLGARRTRLLYIGLLALALTWPLLIVAVGSSGVALAWLSLLLVPSLWRQLGAATTGSEFNRLLAGTARLHAVYGVLFAVGLAL